MKWATAPKITSTLAHDGSLAHNCYQIACFADFLDIFVADGHAAVPALDWIFLGVSVIKYSAWFLNCDVCMQQALATIFSKLRIGFRLPFGVPIKMMLVAQMQKYACLRAVQHGIFSLLCWIARLIHCGRGGYLNNDGSD